MQEILITALFSIGFNIAMFFPAFKLKTDKLTDISYALTFMAVGVFSFSRSDRSFGHLLLLFAVLLWASRLGVFLYIRIMRMKVDHRFDDKRDSFFKFLGFWLIQGITVPVVMIASVLYFNSPNPKVGALSVIGLLVFLTGLIIEAVADQQKFQFGGNPSNRDKWIASGIWKYSRHPNYLGEIMVWTGVFIFVATTLSGLSILAALLSPLYIAGLLLFVSGIPLLEKSADKKWGSNPKYIEYKKRTPVLIPFVK